MTLKKGITEKDGNFKTIARMQAAVLVAESLAFVDGIPYKIKTTDLGDGVLLNNGNFANPVETAQTISNTSEVAVNTADILAIQTLPEPLLDLFSPNQVVNVIGRNADGSDGALSSTRASVATIRDRYGVLQTVANDVLRTNENGALIEDAGAELLLQTEDLGDAVWANSGAAILTNVIAAPDGTMTGDSVQSLTNGQTVRQEQTVPADTATYVLTWFLKEGTAATNTISLQFRGGTTVNYDKTINWATIDSDPDAEKWADGWYRVSSIGANDGAGTIVRAVCNGDQGSINGLTYFGGVNIKQSSGVTSYTKVEAAPETREKDVVVVPYHNNFTFLSAWTVAVELSDMNVPTSGSLTFLGGAEDNRPQFQVHNDSQIRFLQRVGNVSSGFTVTQGEDDKIAITYDGTTISFYKNGVLGTSVPFTVELAIPLVSMLVGASGQQIAYLGSPIKRLRSYDEALTIEQIRLL